MSGGVVNGGGHFRGRRRGRRRDGRRWLLRFVLGVVDHPWRTLIVAAAVLAASVVAALLRLPVSTDQDKLFSPTDPVFRDWLRFESQFPENDAVYVVVQPTDPAATPPPGRWVAAADAIAERLRGVPRYVKSVQSRVPLDRLGEQGILFAPPADLPQRVAEAKRAEPLAKLWGERPGWAGRLLGDAPMTRFLAGSQADAAARGLLGGPDTEAGQLAGRLAEHWGRLVREAARAPDPAARARAAAREVPDLQALAAEDPGDLGYYYEVDRQDRSRHLLLVRVFPTEDFSSLSAQWEAVEAIRQAVAAAAREFPEFSAGVTGRPALGADEMEATDRDSHRAEVVALSAVFVGLVVVLRSLWLALAAEIALAVGIGWAFGWATLAVGELNLLSLVFLIALIGIGMDYLVQILVRYRHESAPRPRSRGVWPRVFRRVSAPINTACLGAAGAFLVSALTDFRGAADLGIIAGGGLLLVLLSGYTVLPALLVVVPGRKGREAKGKIRSAAAAASLPLAPGRGRGRRAAWVGPLAWAGALAVAVPFMFRASFDPNLLNLQVQDLPSVRLIRKLQTWSAVCLSKDLASLRRARAALTGAATVASTESLLDARDNAAWLRDHAGELPRVEWAVPEAVRAEDLPALAARARGLAGYLEPPAAGDAESARSLRDFAAALEAVAGGPPATRAAVAEALTAWQAAFVERLKGMLARAAGGPLDVRRLPRELRDHFVSEDGTYALYVNPGKDLWEREDLEQFAREVSERAGAVANAPVVTGVAVNLAHTTFAVERAFYRATAYAMGLILLLVLIDLRDVGQTLAAVSVLALGLPMLVGLMGALGARWNFANFFGLPLLIGAGHEYGVFLVHRYRQARREMLRRGTADAWPRGDPSDRALLLCAYVTATSFAFFWLLGRHQGLRSLGLVMALGTACIYLAAVLVLRPLLRWRLRRAR